MLAWSFSWNEHYRVQAIWVAGGLSVYAASLLILEAMQRVSNQDIQTAALRFAQARVQLARADHRSGVRVEQLVVFRVLHANALRS